MYRNKTHAEFEMTIPAGDKIRPAASIFNDRFFFRNSNFLWILGSRKSSFHCFIWHQTSKCMCLKAKVEINTLK